MEFTLSSSLLSHRENNRVSGMTRKGPALRCVVALVMLLQATLAHALSTACSTLNANSGTTSYTGRFASTDFDSGESITFSYTDNGQGAGGSPITSDLVNLRSRTITTVYSDYRSYTGSAGSYTATVSSAQLAAGGLYAQISTGTYISAVSITCSAAVVADASLAGLSLSVGTLSPTFATATTTYTAAVSNSASAVVVRPTARASDSTITVNGAAVASGSDSSAISLAVGANTITVGVTAADGQTTKTYSITVTRTEAAPLATDVTAGVAANSTNNAITLAITGSPTSVAVASAASHGTATASGTSITYTPVAGYSGTDIFTYTATNANGTSAPATVTITVNAPTLAISPTTLPNATASNSYSQSLSSANGTAPYSYAVTAGALPAGLTLNSGGTLSGTPSAVTTGNFTITATDAYGATGNRTYSLTVDAATIAITPTTLGSLAVGSAYSQNLSASGGNGSYIWSTSGTLPPGITVNSNGLVSGTPTTAGNYSFIVTATDSLGSPGSRGYSVTVNEQAPVAGNSSLTVQGGSGSTPVPLNLSGGSVTLVTITTLATNGTATATGSGITYAPNPGFAGSDSFSYTATGPGGTSSVATVSVAVTAPTIIISPATLTNATQNTAYSQTLTASGGTGPYTFSVVTGSPPAGLNVSSAGVVSGTPTATGTFSFTVRTTDNGGFSASQAYTLVVTADQTPVAGPVSATVAANSSANPITLNLSGGAATSVSVTGSPSHGSTAVSGTTITYTPTAGYSGSDSFTYSATGSGGSSAPATVSLTISAPTLALTPANLVSATANTAYSQGLAANGGTAPYSFSVTSGALPSGVSLSSAGILSGTPSAAGTFNFTVQATDSLGATGSQALALTVAYQAPVAGPVSVTVAANSSANPITLNLGGGGITGIGVASAPSHGTTSVSGTNLSYTPTAGYSGNDSFTYAVTGPGGTSAAATVNITVTAPTLVITPSTPGLPGATQSMAYSASLAASGGMAPYSYALSGSLPAGLSLDSATGAITGTPTAVVNSNFTINVTDANGASGTRSYSLTVVAQAVVVPPSSETLAPGQSASVDLTRDASGGPFLRARLLSVSPASAGTASLSGPFTLRFVPAAAFAGSAVVSFSLENTGGNTATSTVTFSVQPRPDPTRDAEVIGLLNAQSRAAERFASTQMDNFNRRLEQLHRPTCDRDSFNADVRRGRDNLNLGGLGKALRDELEGNGVDADDDEQRRKEKDSSRASAGECSEEALAFWTDGFINSGSNQARGAKDNSFTTFGLSAGMDYRLSPRTVVGLGVGYGNDRTDIGEHDSRSEGDALGLAAYLSANPLSEVYIDALLGYNRIRFDSRRYVTADPSNGYASGSRDADQLFASLTASYEYRQGALSLAPYARVNSSYTRLDGYSEHGGGIYALSYEEQDLRYFTSFLGWRTSYDIQTSLGVLTPRVGLAWGHNFNRNQDYRVRYADQGDDGMLYRLSPDPMDTNFIDMDSGLSLSLGRAWRVALSYRSALGTNERNEMFRIGLDGKF
ncbi:IPT/TIG domain/outer membrane autotransporter barrel domain-containing protein [Pseudomonas sp. RW407]|nr:IPT/TIG domain/outer membrane autotransporter barrel domain-containing protein [Pseudomonas sp. RW407]